MLRKLLRHLSSSRRLGIFLCFVGFVWGIALINISMVGYTTPKDPEMLREEILELSEKYVRALARESQDTIDGPYSGRLTGYDLKKTMAVLLENIVDRMNKIEKKVDLALALQNSSVSRLAAVGQESADPQLPLAVAQAQQKGKPQIMMLPQIPAEKPVGVKDLLLGAQEVCSLTAEQKKLHPACESKTAWMKNFWKSDSCYAENGVDGSDCSFRVYLSEIESWCPLLPGRSRMQPNMTRMGGGMALVRLDPAGLMSLLQDPGQRQNYAWIRLRIQRMWPNWVAAAKTLMQNSAFQKRQQKRVLVHLGLLSKKSGFKIAENSFRGGPLGELVQWSDIISALYVMGHDLTITSEVEQLSVYLTSLGMSARKKHSCPVPLAILPRDKPDLIYTDLTGFKQLKQTIRQDARGLRILAKFPNAESQCQSRAKLPLDMIYTDIVGLIQFKRKVKHGYGKFSCLLRIIDSFGTEPAFNLDSFAKSHKLKTQWGMQNLIPQQFYTMFPHSPDNSFMGFVVERHLNDTKNNITIRKPQAVVYGKAEYMWQGKESYLGVIKKYVDIHGTVFLEKGQSSVVPSFINNHGILSGPDLHQLLRNSKLFIGLGFPYEGPAPLEAIAQGCAFINPKFDPPHNSQNTKFFKGKPNLRKVTSQHPYAEEFIGEPHVHTVDINDLKQVDKVVQEALADVDSGKVEPYMPYEYTEAGMIERLGAYIEHQDFCNPNVALWPPADQIKPVLADKGQSCKDACMARTMICEPSNFKTLNVKEQIEKVAGSLCQEVKTITDIYWPAYEPTGSKCILQKEPLLFSCVGELADVRRLCPCRDFVKGQTALCSKCL